MMGSQCTGCQIDAEVRRLKAENEWLRESIRSHATATNPLQLLNALHDRPCVSGDVVMDKCVRRPTTLAEQVTRAQKMFDDLMPNK